MTIEKKYNGLHYATFKINGKMFQVQGYTLQGALLKGLAYIKAFNK